MLKLFCLNFDVFQSVMVWFFKIKWEWFSIRQKYFNTPKTKLLGYYFCGKQRFCPEFEWQLKSRISYGIFNKYFLTHFIRNNQGENSEFLLCPLKSASHSFLSSKCHLWLCSLDSLSLPGASTFYKLLFHLWQCSSEIPAAEVPHHNLLFSHPSLST